MASTKTIFNKYGLDGDDLLDEALKIVADAGDVLMDFYNKAEDDPDAIGVELKGDNSPVTKADKAASHLIETRLQKVTPGMAVMCEENATEPANGEPFWAIDPLDGTKLFINRTGGFAVNMALIIEGTPVLGVVNAPALGTLYYSAEGFPAFKETKSDIDIMKTRKAFRKGALKAQFDVVHAEREIYDAQRLTLFEQRDLPLPAKPETMRTHPSNLMVADGLNDLHVKTGKDATLRESAGYIWDNAADFIILQNAGGVMVEINSGKPLTFDQGRGRQPAYISFGDRDLAEKTFPGCSL